MTTYLPLSLDAYSKTFSCVSQEEKIMAHHSVYKWGERTIVSPQQILTEAATPANLFDLKRELEGNELLIIDRTHSSEPVGYRGVRVTPIGGMERQSFGQGGAGYR